MSAYLGPIHYWLYNKIKIQNEIAEDIISLSEKKNLNLNLRNRIYEQYGDGKLKPLEEVIDVANIHGWLQERVSQVEYKLAYAVTELLEQDPNILEDLKALFREKGSKISAIDKNTSLRDALKAINDTLLDGMPCDHANTLVADEQDEVIWKRNLCVHREYWDAAEGDINNYYILRDELIKGMLEKADVKYEKLDETISRITRS